jgi:stage II sporulation protein M|tara:strand:- start:232 stop:825 length:594 start_codon:yes stop_codon:yes gene_type:complete
MKNKKIFNFIEEYKKSWNFIKESKNFIYSVIGIFFVFSLIGFFITAPAIIAEQILKFIEELLLKTQGMGHFELIKFIFFNNVQSSFFGMIFGVFLGIFPIVAVIANGYMLGFVASLVVNSEGISVLWRLFPHGIFELPAIFISLGLGLKIGTFIFQKKKLESLKKYFLNSLRVFLFIILPLLIIAAIVEGSLIYLVG